MSPSVQQGILSSTADKAALDTLSPGDIATIFTPDDTHFAIAKYAISRGLHVLITKPAVKTVAHHAELLRLVCRTAMYERACHTFLQAQARGVLVMVEFHKRFDPTYSDARGKAQKLGDFAYFNSFMSQPKYQLEA